MIKLALAIYWCIEHGIGDIIFWPLVLVFAGFWIWLMEDCVPQNKKGPDTEVSEPHR